jgi:hypothetical protein
MASEGVLSFEGRQRGEGREDGTAPMPPIGGEDVCGGGEPPCYQHLLEG